MCWRPTPTRPSQSGRRARRLFEPKFLSRYDAWPDGRPEGRVGRQHRKYEPINQGTLAKTLAGRMALRLIEPKFLSQYDTWPEGRPEARVAPALGT